MTTSAIRAIKAASARKFTAVDFCMIDPFQPASVVSVTASGLLPKRTSTLVMPNMERSCSAGTVIRPGGGGGSGGGLGKGFGAGRMEGHVAFDLLHNLVDVPVQHRDRAEALQHIERLQPIVGAPAPIGIDGPKRDVGEHDDWGGICLALEVVG